MRGTYRNPSQTVSKSDAAELCQQIEAELAQAVVDYMIDHIEADMKGTMQVSDFYGDAEQYMRDNCIQFTMELRQQYAVDIYNSFFNNLPDAIQFDRDTLTIAIHPKIWELEYGSAMVPTLKYVSKSIKAAINDVVKHAKNS